MSKFYGKQSVLDSCTLGSKVKCWYCGREGDTEADHFYPKSKGGRLKVRCCRECNQDKKDRTPLQWIAYLQIKIRRYDPENKHTLQIIEKIARSIRASQTLWDRVSWSVVPNRTIHCDDQTCKFNDIKQEGCLHPSPEVPTNPFNDKFRNCNSFINQ